MDTLFAEMFIHNYLNEPDLNSVYIILSPYLQEIQL